MRINARVSELMHEFRAFALTPSEIMKSNGVEHQDSQKIEKKNQGDEKNFIKAKVCIAMFVIETVIQFWIASNSDSSINAENQDSDS